MGVLLNSRRWLSARDLQKLNGYNSKDNTRIKQNTLRPDATPVPVEHTEPEATTEPEEPTAPEATPEPEDFFNELFNTDFEYDIIYF